MEIQSLWFAGRVMRLRFGSVLITKIYIFSDEAHFNLNGQVNQKICPYWSSENPKEKHETQLHSLRSQFGMQSLYKVIYNGAIHAQGIIGRYFFENGCSRAVTVDSDRYVDMLNNLFEPALQDFDEYNRDTWFQKDLSHFK